MPTPFPTRDEWLATRDESIACGGFTTGTERPRWWPSAVNWRTALAAPRAES